jgi:large subunit ribosomal protein L13
VKTLHILKNNEERKWFLIDAQDQVLGRLASKLASILRGKGKTDYSPQWDCGDYVVVVNANKVRLTGKKEKQKSYFKASQYPGNSTSVPYLKVKERFPERIIYHAVEGMVSHGTLGRKICSKLFAYAGTEHPHAAQNPIKITI